ncbi:TetR/AcrR family transcriptional regulator [Streptomyces sp. NPDC052043]|uniref:TetR/AcrR family transcriptional regulator n=1 Tax=Streptomyces sp. NPDC052043 TaxID=3365684 RepID=UPI0037D36786
MARAGGAGLSRRTIAGAALAVIDEEGADALTVRRIADRLGVRAPSLYNHVPSRDDILDAVTELIIEKIDFTALDSPDPHTGIAALARSYRRAFGAHPNAVGLIGGRSVRTTMALSHYDGMVAALLRAGRPADDAMRILLAIDYLALGAALAPFAAGFGHLTGTTGGEDDHPHLSAALAAVDPATVDDQAFERVLAAFLDTMT